MLLLDSFDETRWVATLMAGSAGNSPVAAVPEGDAATE
jgi:hypothetical protein